MLTARRWRLVHALGLELLEVGEPDEQLLAGLHSLLRLVPGDVAAEVRIDPSVGTSHVTEVPDLLLPLAAGEAEELFLTNPAVPYLAAHGELPASRVEDLCTPREWARNPMRRHLLEPARVPHALLAAHLTGRGAVHGWGVNRSRPFGDEEVEVFRAFEPFLRRAAQDRSRTALLIDLDHAVASGAGLVLFRGEQVVHLNEEAGTLLERHAVGLPTLLRLSRASLSAAHPVGSLPSRRGVLRLRWRPALPGSTAVVLHDAVGLPGLRDGLTPQQYAVLCHLSHGLTAGAIARRLGVSERTVHKHLENLYRALGVGDRLNAVLRGRELGLLPVLQGCGQVEHLQPPAPPAAAPHRG